MGSAAILASVVTLFPSIRTTLAALGTYAATWVIFNIVRAFAEDVPLAIAAARTISDVEAATFGGGLPSAWLQRRFFGPDSIAGWDIALSIVHGSFFVAPFLLAGTIWWRRRNLFRRYAVATAISFALSLPGSLLLPSAPPWLSDPDSVIRINIRILNGIGGVGGEGRATDERFVFEPNHLAAFPSVHVAVAVLVALAASRFGAMGTVLGALYALAMSIAVVYLGKHFALDVAMGWTVALAGWTLARGRTVACHQQMIRNTVIAAREICLPGR